MQVRDPMSSKRKRSKATPDSLSGCNPPFLSFGKRIEFWARSSEERLKLEFKESAAVVLPQVAFDFRFPSDFCPRQLQVKLNLDFEDRLESEMSTTWTRLEV